VEVLHGVRPSQSPRPRVMQGLAARLNLKRSQGDHGLGIELRNGSNSEVPIQFEDEKATSSRWNGLATRSLAQSETPCTWRRPLYGTWEASSASGSACRTGS
jgi:hypothetical protein